MALSYLLDPVQILKGNNQSLVQDAVLIKDGVIQAFGEKARSQGNQLGITPKSAPNQLLAPCLVDPHSVLEEPIHSQCETLKSLRIKAANAGYVQLALLPRSPSFRDRADRLTGFNNSNSDVLIHLWGSISKNGKGVELSPYAEMLQHGAIGLAEDDAMLPISLLKHVLTLNDKSQHPILLAPRDVDIQEDGIVREGIEALRGGWLPDPLASETLPLSQLIELHRQYPKISLRLMNISTADGVSMLAESKTKPISSVCWWHLIKDSSSLHNNELGWRVVPSLGRPKDRRALIQGLANKTITAIAVHAIPLDEEETKLPTDKRLPGISSYSLVLPLLWQELVVNSKWSIEQLWDALSFGPSTMLCLPKEELTIGSRRWLLFDPNKKWKQTLNPRKKPFCANQPLQESEILGGIVDCGIKSEGVQND